MYTIVGLGNPGGEYEDTRHNAGRIVLTEFLKTIGADEMKVTKKYNALTAEGKLKKEKIHVLFPETFMNKSGTSLKTLITSKKKAETLVVVHDDLDLALGVVKISFNRGSGGHRGVESIIRAIKTEGFVRIRIGISPVTPGGKVKKPKGEDKVDTFIIGAFSHKEMDVITKISKKVNDALVAFIQEGREHAMSHYNQ